MPKIFLLNGPPGAGKDTAAIYLAGLFKGTVMKFATPLKDGCTAIYCNNNRAIFDEFDTYERKGIPDARFIGISCRQAQIDMSEKYMKPVYGQDVFGKILANKIDVDQEGFIFVSDSGFAPEAQVLVEKFGKENVILIKIEREGHTYEAHGDSRSYIELDEVDTHIIVNEEDNMMDFYKELTKIVKTYVPTETQDGEQQETN